MKELIDKEGNIIRVGITGDGIFKITISSIRYINKTLSEEEIMKMYNNYRDAIIERRKRYISKTGRLCTLINLTIIPYNKFRQIMIEDYQLIGIPYIDKKKEIYCYVDSDGHYQESEFLPSNYKEFHGTKFVTK